MPVVVRKHCVLLVNRNPSVRELVETALPQGWPLVEVADTEGARSVVAARVLSGLVVELERSVPEVESLAQFYLDKQGYGRAVLLAGEPGEMTLARLDLRDQRIELLFAPWGPAQVRTALRLPGRGARE